MVHLFLQMLYSPHKSKSATLFFQLQLLLTIVLLFETYQVDYS